MTCPECQIDYDPDHWDSCPHCGCGHEAVGTFEVSGVVRTSAILIAAGEGEPKFYRSLEEVPEPMRQMLESSTSGPDSGTVFIADREGRAQVVRALRSLPAPQPATALTRFSSTVSPQPRPRAKRRVSLATLWFALVIALFSGAVIWLVGSHGW